MTHAALDRSERKFAQKRGTPLPEHIVSLFDDDFLQAPEHAALLSRVSLVVAMHADGATEAANTECDQSILGSNTLVILARRAVAGDPRDCSAAHTNSTPHRFFVVITSSAGIVGRHDTRPRLGASRWIRSRPGTGCARARKVSRT